MGNDDIFKKRKARSNKVLERKEAIRQTQDVILVICEGEKSEVHYLSDLRNDLMLNKQNIEIIGTGLDPSKLLEEAKKMHNQNAYDRIFCIFDHDNHSHFESTKQKINSLRKTIQIEAIISIPCFEYWLLLHFEKSNQPYHPTAKKSASDQVISKLRKHIKDYNKGHASIFAKTKIHLNEAIITAKQIYKLQKANNTNNPSTNFYVVVEYLQKMSTNYH